MRGTKFGGHATRARIVVLLTGVAVMAACTSNPAAAPNSSAAGPAAATGPESAAPTAASLIDDSQLTADLAGVTQRKVATVAPTRLATGLVPPTNRWFSGLVFNDQPQPVFPMPLSVAETDTGFGLGLPTVTASEKMPLVHSL